MKKCVYCGQEYPDDAAVCAVDQQPLTSDGRPSPQQKTRVVDFSARPFTVTFAVQLLAADTFFRLVQEIVSFQSYVHRYPNFHYSSIDFYVATACGLGIWVLFLYFVYRGRNWARWLVSCLIVLGIIVTLFMMTGRLGWIFYFHSLINIGATVALFQHSSNAWYKGSKKTSSEQMSAV